MEGSDSQGSTRKRRRQWKGEATRVPTDSGAKGSESIEEGEQQVTSRNVSAVEEVGECAQEEAAVASSEAMEASIQQIQLKMEQFTQQVASLLEAGKAFFAEILGEFEDGVLELHQTQCGKWVEEIEQLRSIDSLNEEINVRLSNAQSLITTV